MLQIYRKNVISACKVFYLYSTAEMFASMHKAFCKSADFAYFERMTEYKWSLTKTNPLANKEGDDVRVLHKLSLVAQVPEPVYKNYFPRKTIRKKGLKINFFCKTPLGLAMKKARLWVKKNSFSSRGWISLGQGTPLGCAWSERVKKH